MKTTRGVANYLRWLSLSGLLSACSMSPQAETPSSRSEATPARPGFIHANGKEAEPATLAEAEALLERARAELDRITLNEPSNARAASQSAAPPRASAPARPAPPEAPAQADARRAEKSRNSDDGVAGPVAAPAGDTNPCQTACQAFSSLTRASDAICRLETDSGKRCERARRIREDASRRVASCGCLR